MNCNETASGVAIPRDATVRVMRCTVPSMGSHGAHPVWRVGAVLRHCLGMSQPERARAWRLGFFKREGRPSEKETLTSRLIDRPLRPLFPESFYNEIQIVAMVV